MPEIEVKQRSFAAGQVGELVEERTDLPWWAQSCKELVNLIPTLQGPVVKRPGTRYIGTVNTAEYKLFTTVNVFGNELILLFAHQELHIFNKNIKRVIIESPYEARHLPDLKKEEVDDVFTIFHPDVRPHVLSEIPERYKVYYALIPADFHDGPYYDINNYCRILTPLQGSEVGFMMLGSPQHRFRGGSGTQVDHGRYVRFRDSSGWRVGRVKEVVDWHPTEYGVSAVLDMLPADTIDESIRDVPVNDPGEPYRLYREEIGRFSYNGKEITNIKSVIPAVNVGYTQYLILAENQFYLAVESSASSGQPRSGTYWLGETKLGAIVPSNPHHLTMFSNSFKGISPNFLFLDDNTNVLYRVEFDFSGLEGKNSDESNPTTSVKNLDILTRWKRDPNDESARIKDTTNSLNMGPEISKTRGMVYIPGNVLLVLDDDLNLWQVIPFLSDLSIDIPITRVLNDGVLKPYDDIVSLVHTTYELPSVRVQDKLKPVSTNLSWQEFLDTIYPELVEDEATPTDRFSNRPLDPQRADRYLSHLGGYAFTPSVDAYPSSALGQIYARANSSAEPQAVGDLESRVIDFGFITSKGEVYQCKITGRGDVGLSGSTLKAGEELTISEPIKQQDVPLGTSCLSPNFIGSFPKAPAWPPA